MSVVDSQKLISLREKLEKNIDENGKLKEQIAKEEKRLKDKEKRENEKWWKDLSKGMETLLISLYGQEYKVKISREEILSILTEHLEGCIPASSVSEDDPGADNWQ